MPNPTKHRTDIKLHSGEYFDFLNPEACSFKIEDIAWGLSNICRFNGHVKQFYSVAQHSVHVAQLLPRHLQLQGLLHDAAEAFIGDVTKPLKELLPGYKHIEQAVEAALTKAYGLPKNLDESVKLADIIMLRTEQRDIVGADADKWHWSEGVLPQERTISAWSPKDSYNAFLFMYKQLIAQPSGDGL